MFHIEVQQWQFYGSSQIPVGVIFPSQHSQPQLLLRNSTWEMAPCCNSQECVLGSIHSLFFIFIFILKITKQLIFPIQTFCFCKLHGELSRYLIKKLRFLIPLFYFPAQSFFSLCLFFLMISTMPTRKSSVAGANFNAVVSSH